MMKRILIADDAGFMRASLKMLLEKNGFQVVGEAENGAVAVKKYKELKPDIVTMDITMPELDGIGAIKIIKQLDPDCKIVVISAMGQEVFVREAVLAGAKGFILKPYQEPHLLETLNKL
ncbi:MAG: response regulator [Clostridia bacterium]|nr:response regulator [Clostridia bacterium]